MRTSLAALLLSGCASFSTQSDYDSVRSIARGRSQLEVRAPSEDFREETDGDTLSLIARPLTTESAVRVALLNNRSLRASLFELGVARGQLAQASLFPNPDFEVQVRFSQDPAQDAQWDLGAGIDLTAILLRGARQSVAEADVDAARLRAAGSTLDLGYRVRLAFYEVQAQQQTLELLRTALAAFGASYDTARALHEAGNVTDLDLVTEQAAYEGYRATVADAEASLIATRERLSVLLGLFGRQTSWEITARLADPPQALPALDRLESRAIEASIELAETRARLTASARRVGLAQATGLVPEINVGVHAEHDGTFWEVGPSVTGRLPLFDRQQGVVISRRAELAALRERYVANAVEIRSAVRTARARALSAEARVRQYHDVVLPLRERVVRETVLQYNAMAVSVFQLLQARRDHLDAGRAYVQTLREYWQSRAALEQLLAGRMPDAMGTNTANQETQPRSPSGQH